MKLINILLISSLLLAVGPCDGEKSSLETKTPAAEISKAMSELGIKTAEKFNGKLDELLTVEMAALVTNNDPDKAEKDYNMIFSDPKTHHIAYSWNNGRQRSMANFGFPSIMTDHSDQVELSWVTSMSEEDFRIMYRELSEQDIQNAKEAMEKRVNEGNMSEESRQIALEMAQSFMNRDQTREWLEGIGDMAVFIPADNSLKVFYKGLTFSMTADISDDAEKNKATAIELSKLIIKEKL